MALRLCFLNTARFLPYSFLLLQFQTIYVHALNAAIHLQAAGAPMTAVDGKECSRVCQSDYCAVPPFLRYGKFCGLKYTGCPGEEPCDGLDTCCMKHDQCIQANNNDYLSQECSQDFLDCMHEFRELGRKTFKDNTCDPNEVVDVVSFFIEAALLAGKVLKKP